jgi:nucleoside-diphosphate-sugar epimerase
MNSPVQGSTSTPMHVLITGGAGYIGSLLTGVLLQRGRHVTVVDDLLFGGESLLAYFSHPHFTFIKGDVCDPEVLARLKAGEPQFRIRVPSGCSAFRIGSRTFAPSYALVRRLGSRMNGRRHTTDNRLPVLRYTQACPLAK